MSFKSIKRTRAILLSQIIYTRNTRLYLVVDKNNKFFERSICDS